MARIVDYDRLASSAPLNTDAAKALGMSGASDVAYLVPDGMDHWDAPPPTLPPPRDKAHRIGATVGRLVVLGYLGSKNDKSKWLVRCRCGMYESRSGKAIDNSRNDKDACLRCRHIANRKREYERQRYRDLHGHWPGEDMAVKSRPETA